MSFTAYIMADIETAPRDDALAWVQPDSRLTDEKKIAASKEERASKLALDPNGCRIVCLGSLVAEKDARITICQSEDEERDAIGDLWSQWRRFNTKWMARFIGFNARRFDLRVLIQRSRYLGLDTPDISLARYGKGDVVDLYELLTFDEPNDGVSVVPRTLGMFCRQFGIDVDDDIDGAFVPEAVARGEWELVAKHNRADLERTRRLAERLGVIAVRKALTEAAR
jgi:hypothetical protein